MKKYIITLFTVLGAFVLNAQIPGYMGKRFSTSVEASVSPGMPLIGWASAQLKSEFYLGLSYGVSFDYAIARKHTLGFKYNYAQYKFSQAYVDNPALDTNLWNVTPVDPYDPVNYETKVAPMNMSIHTFAISWKRFNTMMAAPLGRYFTMDLGASIMSANDINGVIPRNNSTEMPKKGKFVGMVQPFFSFGWGTQRVYFNGLLQNVNINLCLYPGMFFMNLDNGYYGDYYYDKNYENYVKSKMRAISANAVLIRLTLGLGAIY